MFDPLEEGIEIHPVFLAGETHGQQSLAGYNPKCHKESDTIEQLSMYKWTVTFEFEVQGSSYMSRWSEMMGELNL